MYQKEEEGLQRKLDKHIADNAEEWDIKNTVGAPSAACSRFVSLPSLTLLPTPLYSKPICILHLYSLACACVPLL